MRVPGIFRWPGKIPSGQRSDAIVGNIDLLPTIAHLTGAKMPDDRVIDGKNLWPLLSDKTASSPHEFFHYFGGGKALGPVNYRGIREVRWKLVVASNADGTLRSGELYDLGADPGEKFNRLKLHPEIATRLLDEAQRFHAELTAHRRPLGEIDH